MKPISNSPIKPYFDDVMAALVARQGKEGGATVVANGGTRADFPYVSAQIDSGEMSIETRRAMSPDLSSSIEIFFRLRVGSEEIRRQLNELLQTLGFSRLREGDSSVTLRHGEGYEPMLLVAEESPLDYRYSLKKDVVQAAAVLRDFILKKLAEENSRS